MRSNLLLLLILGLVGTALVAGCGGDDEAPMAPSKQAEKAPAGSMAGETADEAPSAAPSDDEPSPGVADMSEQLRVTIEIPSYYPEDGPIYPGAKPSQAQQATNGRVSMVFGTDDMPAEASALMNQAAEELGWSIMSEDQIERGLLTQAEKDGRKMMILTSRMDGGSSDPVTLVAVSVDP